MRHHRSDDFSSNKKLLIVNIILPVNLALCIAMLVLQFLFMQTEVDKNGIVSKRFLYKAIKAAVRGDIESVPHWISFITMGTGEILYPELTEELLMDVEEYNKTVAEGMSLEEWSVYLSEHSSDYETFMGFTYNGNPGMCIYKGNKLPGPLLLIYNPVYLGFMALLVSMAFAFGAVLMNSHHRNVQVLVRASQRIKLGDFETPIESRCHNELYRVFEAWEEMRRELLAGRNRGILMITGITHDLKTPLTSMRMYLEAMRDGVIEEELERNDAINKTLSKAGMLEDRIDEMLYAIRSISSGWTEDDVLDTSSWINELDHLFSEECSLNQRRYESDIRIPEALELKGSQRMLTRAVHNLLDNAVRYTKEEDRIRFSVHWNKEDAMLVLRLEDSGPGIPPEEREVIFDMFFRKDKGRNTRGMGIGLAAVKFMAQDHGGSVSCVDTELGGACFEVRLPVID